MAIDLLSQTIEFEGVAYQIQEWTIWYMTPFGLYQELDKAVKRVSDMDPNLTVIPVPVAIASDRIFEVWIRV